MIKELKPGQPCNHPGCCNHISHPCEGCGRIACGLKKQGLVAPIGRALDSKSNGWWFESILARQNKRLS